MRIPVLTTERLTVRELDEGDLVDVGPVDVFGEPLEICRN